MATTWNPADKTASIALSGGNLVATASATFQGVRTIGRVGSGKYYFEITWTTLGSGGGFGLANAAAVLGTSSNALNTSVDAVIVYGNGVVWVNGSSTSVNFGTPANGSLFGIAVDFDVKRVWFRLGAAGNWNNNASNNPATNVGGLSVSAINPDSRLSPLYVICGSTTGTGSVFTANFGDSAFSGAVPSGFTSGFPTGTPPLIGAATQLALEQWASPNPQSRLTQLGLEMWTSTTAVSGRAILTQLGLEQWVVLPAAAVEAQRQYAVTVIT